MSSSDGQAERQAVSIVALGAFNPAIFHPDWFVRKSLLPEAEGEAAAAKTRLLSPEVTAFETDWFQLQVTQERFAIETNNPARFLPMRDLAAGTFGLLEHTPITAFGLNFVQVFKFPQDGSLDRISAKFAPNSAWTELIFNNRLEHLTMQGSRPNCDAERIQIELRPLVQRLVISINEHYKINPDVIDPSSSPAIQMVARLENSWNDFQEFSRNVGEKILKAGNET